VPEPRGDDQFAGYAEHLPRVGFFTDTSACIGCKACEVACKEWNAVPDDGLTLTGMSYDNTGGLGASTWRHVAFIEQIKRPGEAQDPRQMSLIPDEGSVQQFAAASSDPAGDAGSRYLRSSMSPHAGIAAATWPAA
jgi:formate dehydrogenase iron-sulfur subunit